MRPPVDEQAAVAVADEDVLRDGQVGEDHRLLVDRGDAQSLRVQGAGDVRLCPSTRISPSSGCSTPVMILISVDLPAPFSPEQGVHLAGEQRDRHAVERLGRPEALANVANLEDRLGRRRVLGGHGRRNGHSR